MPIFQPIVKCSWSLTENQIDVWRFSSQLDYDWWPILDAHEQARANRFYFPKHRARFIQTHGVLRALLSRYENANPKSLQFDSKQHGKPFLVDSKLSFNLSHSEKYAVLAVGKQQAIGVDVEAVKARPLVGIANQMFSEKERLELNRAAPTRKHAVFFSIWSQKEAFIKACGLGLRYPTKTFSSTAFLFQPYPIADNLNNKEWTMLPFFSSPGYAAAVCYDIPQTKVRFYRA